MLCFLNSVMMFLCRKINLCFYLHIFFKNPYQDSFIFFYNLI